MSLTAVGKLWFRERRGKTGELALPLRGWDRLERGIYWAVDGAGKCWRSRYVDEPLEVCSAHDLVSSIWSEQTKTLIYKYLGLIKADK